MVLLLIIAAFFLLFFIVGRRRSHFIKHGRFKSAQTVKLGRQRFYIEEVGFDNSQAAIHGYFNIVPDLYDYGDVLEYDYDFFDFYTVVLRFENCTMKLVRQLTTVRLIKSEFPIDIADFEQRITPIAYNKDN